MKERKKEGLNKFLLFQTPNQSGFALKNNTFFGTGRTIVFPNVSTELIIEGNTFNDQVLVFTFPEKDIQNLNISKNSFNLPVLLEINNLSNNYTIGWDQFSKGIINVNVYRDYFFGTLKINPSTQKPYQFYELFTKDVYNTYLKSSIVENEDLYKAEIKLRGKFHNLYKEQFDNTFANSVYTEMKDLETNRLAYLNTQNPNFQTFFTWKVNQFLKVFSAYGTEPARSIIFSVYVILCFALIYLFFPNSWDKHGKNRIINRYRFFTKYMNRKAGIHEVYLEEQKNEMLEYEEFKEYMTASEKSIPKFFTATALPLYKWAISGTKLSASLLKRVDIMKGTWQDLPQSKRIWKSILLVAAFLIAVIYDIFIKMLNALMLSINTFTTLGFGEIPIKGLPRYLAIIQGFIGWFMLTIFSVSLISQLLN